MKDFRGKVAVITGAASGIGLALAERLAQEGMTLVLADIEEPRLRGVADAFSARGVPVAALKVDVSDADQVEALAALAYDRFGAVHLLCNNAGIVPAGRFRPVWEFPLEDWKWAFDVNMMGVVHGLRSFVPRMLAGGEAGHVVNTASIAGLLSGAGTPVYGAAKHAVVRISEALYASLEERGAPIGVTILCPGLVQTRIYDSERNRPEALVPDGGVAAETPDMHAAIIKLGPGALPPAAVADMVVDAVAAGQLYCLTTDAFDAAIRERNDAVIERRNPRFANLLALTQDESGKRLKS